MDEQTFITSASKKTPSKVVFIGNIPKSRDKPSMFKLFSKIGTIEKFRVPFDKASNKHKGYGFCQFTNLKDAAKAIYSYNQLKVDDKNLVVEYSDHQEIVIMGGSKTNYSIEQNISHNGSAPTLVLGQAYGSTNPPPPNSIVGQPQLAPHNIQQLSFPFQQPVPDLFPQNTADPVYNCLSMIPSQNLLNSLISVKHLLQSDSQVGRNVLIDHPNLCICFLHMLHICDLLQKPEVKKSAIDKESVKKLLSLSEEQIRLLNPALRKKIQIMREKILKRK